MIVLFQMIICTGKQLFQYLFAKLYGSYFPFQDDSGRKVKCIYEGEPACYDSERGLRFSPPLYSQRYLAVQDLIKDEKWVGKIHKIVDFGCAELKFFKYSKNIRGVREVLEVDILSSTLECNIYRVQPLISDFIQRRSEALDVSVLAGSIKDPDPRLLNADMVVAIEIIEHLYPDTLEAIPYNIFEFIKPRVVVFTTPNADFNILFPSFNQFRHDDHKFEWTRQQFQDWANNIVARFPEYTVSFDGVGALPTGTLENLGCCTQMAIFHNENNESRVLREYDTYQSYGICTYKSYTAPNDNPMYIDDNYTRPCYYKLITQVNFPYEEIDETSRNNKILQEIIYRLSIYGSEYGLYFNYSKWRSEVPITFLHTFVRDLCSLDELIMILKDHYETENRLINDTIQMCIIYENQDTSTESSSICIDEIDNASTLNVMNGYGDSDSEWETIQYNSPKHSYGSVAVSHVLTDENPSERIIEEFDNNIQSNDVAIDCHLSEELIENKDETSMEIDNLSKSSLNKEEQISDVSKTLSYFRETDKDTMQVNDFSVLIDDASMNPLASQKFINNVKSSKMTKPSLTSEHSLLPIDEYSTTPLELKNKFEIHNHGNGSHNHKTDKNYKLFKSNSKHIEINVKLKNSKSDLTTNHKLNDRKFKAFPPVPAAAQINQELKPALPVPHPVNLPHIHPEQPKVVENGDLINNNRDDEGNNYEAAGYDDENDGFENKLEDWNFDQHNENHIVHEDHLFDPVAPDRHQVMVQPKDHAAEHVIEYVVPGKIPGGDIVKDLTEPVNDKIHSQAYQVNDFSIMSTSEKSKYSVYFSTDTNMYRDAQHTSVISDQSTSSLEVNTSNVDVDELSMTSGTTLPGLMDVSSSGSSGINENMHENSLIPEPFPEWLMRLMPAVNLENQRNDLDYLSQGDNLTVNPNDDDFEESSSTDSDNDEDADDEDDGMLVPINVEDSDQGLAFNVHTSMLVTEPAINSQQSLSNVDSIETEEYFFDTYNDLQCDELSTVNDTPTQSVIANATLSIHNEGRREAQSDIIRPTIHYSQDSHPPT